MVFTRRARRYQNRKTRKNKQRGGANKFTGLTYISSGSEGVVYRTSDGRALKIQKSGKINEREITAQEKLSEIGIPYFPALYERDICLSTIDFSTVNKEGLTEFCDGTGPYQYDYVVMELIKGKEYPQYLLRKLIDMGAWERKILSDEEIALIANEYISILCRLAFAFYCADRKMYFRHNDFDYKNSLITSDARPIIIDFGSASFIGSDNFDRNTPSGKDMLGFIRSTIGPSHFKSAIKKMLFTKDNYKNTNMNYIKNESKPRMNTSLSAYSSILKQLRESDELRGVWLLASLYKEASILDYIYLFETIKTGVPEEAFDFERSFRNLGIPEDEIQRTKGIVPPALAPRRQNVSGINTLINMGFERMVAQQVLNATDGNLQRSINILTE